ncbi:MAG: carboxylating nicotinate-nucleotide diphosphorylase [Alphaproteobacteria bacterium]|nr:carboxylating nicotinate-nucleotide diphosphorylase [Alphaproteobacteria bacterium]
MPQRDLAPLPRPVVETIVASALAEDLGLIGDITTEATIPAGRQATCIMAARQGGILAGIDIAATTFRYLNAGVRFEAHIRDGQELRPGDTIATISGDARALLSGERVALNFMGRMCGIATQTRAYVDRVSGTRAGIIDTRKTTPGLRALEKYAVRAGGGMNHRIGLFDAVLIKDNHVAIAGGIAPAIEAARARAGHMIKIEVEVDTLDQLREALEHDIDAVLLDNMPPSVLLEAVAIVDGRVTTEASGGVNLDTVRAIAETGVDLISVGALTHSVIVLDIGLDTTID